MLTNPILKYVRAKGRILPNGQREKGAPVGVVLAAVNPETKTIHLGWSLARTHKRTVWGDVIPLDRFDRNNGIHAATERAEKGTSKPVPHSVMPEYREMAQRAVRYFKDATLAESVHDVLNFS